MGIGADNARLLLECRSRGVTFGRTLMIGRQNIYIGGREWRRLLASLGLAGDRGLAAAVTQSGDYAEPFFQALGATAVDSLDASEFEGATRVHDLNEPIPPDWEEAYDVVYDGGTLEHVFHFPVAIGNCMRMTRTGGHLLLHTPANNFLGHGFYQFSPELLFRVLSPANGFRTTRMVALELGVRSRRYEVVDPNEVQARGQVVNRVPVILHVEARKEGPTPPRLREVQQSDYQARWKRHAESGEAVPQLADTHHGFDPRWRRRLLDAFPRLVRMAERWRATRWAREFSFRNRANYRRLR